MAYSYVQYTGDGTTRLFSITFPYIDSTNVEVRVDGVLKAVTTNYTFPTSSSIQFLAGQAPADGAIVDIRRNTQKTSRLVDFQDAAVLTEAALDQNSDQIFYVAQETQDDMASKLGKDNTGVYDAGNTRIKNVADPTSAQDAATKNWVETGMTSQVAAAAASASSAATAATNANTAKLAAEAAQAAAELAQTGAETAETNAAASASTATTQAGIATTQATNASGSASAAAASASSASGSATAAAGSATSAAASYDSFDDRYLGAKASDPTLDNDGDALLAGALYWNTTAGEMRVYSGSAWVTAYVPSSGYVLTTTDQSIAGIKTFTGQVVTTETKETVYNLTGTVIDPANGEIQYKTLSGNTTLTESLESGQSVTLMIDDGTAYTVTWPTTTWVGGSAPTLATTGYTVIVLWKVSTTLYGKHVGDA